jgi:precorrin-2 dehydrogenase / sirohydrochlorin ferrochelatase
MRYFPINLDIRGKPVVVVGGGSVAARKCLSLIAAGARVIVIAPLLAPPLLKLAEEDKLSHLSRKYSAGDLAGAFLVFAATDSPMVNRAVANEAKMSSIPVDIADSPDLSDFTSPAAISRDELLITVSTGGAAPALAGKIREELEERYGPEYALLIKILGRVREKLLTEKANSQYNKKVLRALVDQELPTLIKRNAFTEIDQMLRKHCGPGFTLAELGLGEKDK